MKSILMIGQSNMAGRGFLHEVPSIYNERIQMLRNGRWQMMTEPINYDRPVSGVSPATSFADAWCRENPTETIGLIPCAEGGTAIDEWSVDGVLFQHAISEAKFAMQNSELIGILWHQGENDSHSGNYQTYAAKLSRIIEALRSELNVPEIPFIIGGLPDFLGKSGFGKGCVEYQQINQELQQFAIDHANCWFVTAEGLTSNPDGIHIDAISQRRFGLRYFAAFTQRKDIMEPLNNEDEQIHNSQMRPHTNAEQMYITSMQFAMGEISYDDFMAQVTKLNQ